MPYSCMVLLILYLSVLRKITGFLRVEETTGTIDKHDINNVSRQSDKQLAKIILKTVGTAMK